MLSHNDPVVAKEMESLVVASRAGDAGAWRELVDRYHRLVRATVHSYRLTGPDAEDVVQTTWLRLVERLDRIEQPERLGGWLITTARRECLAVLKRRHREVPVMQSVDDVADPGPDPEESAVTGDVIRALHKAMSELSNRRRAVLVALFLDVNTDYATVAARIGLPVGSIGPTRGRALAELRDRLIAFGYDVEKSSA